MTTPSSLIDSVSPVKMLFNFVNASSVVRLRNDATSPVNPVMAADIRYPASPVMLNAFAIAPYVPIYFLAVNSDNPNCLMAFLAKASTFWFMSPKVTSTTFWTSVRLDPSSTQDFPNAVMAAMLNTVPAAAATFR